MFPTNLQRHFNIIALESNPLFGLILAHVLMTITTFVVQRGNIFIPKSRLKDMRCNLFWFLLGTMMSSRIVLSPSMLLTTLEPVL